MFTSRTYLSTASLVVLYSLNQSLLHYFCLLPILFNHLYITELRPELDQYFVIRYCAFFCNSQHLF